MDLTDSTDIEGPTCVDASFFEQGLMMKHTDGGVCEKPPPMSDHHQIHTSTSVEEHTLDKTHLEKACNIPEKQMCDSRVSRTVTEADDQFKGTVPCKQSMEVTKHNGDMDISVVPQRCEKRSHSSVVNACCDADVPKGSPKEGQLCGFRLPVFQETRADQGFPVSINVFTLAREAGVLSEENAFENKRKLDLKPIEQTDGVACVLDDSIVTASTEEYTKSILKRPNTVESSLRKTSNTVHFASPIMFVSVIEETEEEECSEDTVILSPEDTSMYYQGVPAFYELNEDNHHMPTPGKKLKLSEALLSDGVNSSSSRSLERSDDEGDIFKKDTDISTTIPLGAGPKDKMCTEQGAIMLHTSERHTEPGDASVYEVDSAIPTSTKTNTEQVKDCACSSRSMITNGPDNEEEVQVVPEHFSKRTITCINLFSEKTTPNDDQLESCPSLLRLDEAGGFLEEEDDGPPCQHLKRVPRLRDILDREASFYRDDSDLDMPLAHLCSELQSMEFELPSFSKDFDSFVKEPIEEMSDSQVSDSWITTSQVLTTENTTGETAIICDSSVIHSDDAISIDHRFQTKQEVGQESQGKRPHIKHSAKISNPEIFIRDPQNVSQDKIAEHQRLYRPMTINEQNFHKHLHHCTNGRPPVVSNKRAALPSSSSIPENRTKQREWNEHGVPEDEISPSMRQSPAVEQLGATNDDNDDHVLLSFKSWVSVSTCYRDGECEEYSVSDSHTSRSNLHRIRASEHGDSDDEISLYMTQETASVQQPEDDHVPLSSERTVHMSKCYQDGECGETLSHVQHTEPEENELCRGKDNSPRQNLKPSATQEKGYKNAQEAFSEMDIDLDGPELLEFAMFLVKGALEKTQKEQPDKDENTTFAMKVPSAFQWQGKLNYEHPTSETNSVDGKVSATLGNLARQVDASTRGEDAKSPLPKANRNNRPRRLGLSRRQKVRPLHPYLTRTRQGASHRTCDD